MDQQATVSKLSRRKVVRTTAAASVRGNDPVTAAAQAMLEALGSDTFLHATTFLLRMFHNITRAPDSPEYWRAGTRNTAIDVAFTTPTGANLLQVLQFEKKDKTFSATELPPDVALLIDASDLLVRIRKRLFVLEAWEIYPSDIVCDKLLGSGEFGEVYRGTWKFTDVAIKMLKTSASSESQKSFCMEANILKNFNHVNVLKMFGVVLSKQPWYIVTELLACDLQSYLRSNTLSNERKLEIMMGLASGLTHLHQCNVIHCDIAARNVLVSARGVPKLADFGLARAVQGDAPFSLRGIRFPISVRWSAPEVWSQNAVSKATDIWSFGVLIHEILTRGIVPYAGLKNAQVQENVLRGYRLPPVPDCAEPLNHLMHHCWATDPLDRPTAHGLAEELLTLKVLVITKTESDDAAVSNPWSYYMRNFADSMPSQRKSTMNVEAAEANDLFTIPTVTLKRLREFTEPLLIHNGDFTVASTRDDGFIISVMAEDIPNHIEISTNTSGTVYVEQGIEFNDINALVNHYLQSGTSFIYENAKISLLRRLQVPTVPVDVELPAELADRDWDLFLCYQPQFHGSVVRTLYEGLQNVHGLSFECFLDQYDAKTRQNWVMSVTQAIAKCKLFVVLVSEPALESIETEKPWDSMLAQLELANQRVKTGSLPILPLFVGQTLQVQHPKKNKVLEIYEDFDGFDILGQAEHLERLGPRVRDVFSALHNSRENGIHFNPNTRDFSPALEHIAAIFKAAYPEVRLRTSIDRSCSILRQLEAFVPPEEAAYVSSVGHGNDEVDIEWKLEETLEPQYRVNNARVVRSASRNISRKIKGTLAEDPDE